MSTKKSWLIHYFEHTGKWDADVVLQAEIQEKWRDIWWMDDKSKAKEHEKIFATVWEWATSEVFLH